jgi:L-ascorbate metabolism protein UlaG (beta-lactamase superfamily)
MSLISAIEEDNPPPGSASLWFLGGSAFAIRFAGRPTVFTDLDAGEEGAEVSARGYSPALSVRRMVFLPFDPSEIRRQAIYLSTHEHADHCEKNAALAVVGRGGIFIGPNSSCELARGWGIPEARIRVLDGDGWEETEVDGIRISSAPGRDQNAIGSNTYIVGGGAVNILHNGDGNYDGQNYLEIASKFRIDVAIINLGRNPRGRDWYHTPYDVARAANDLEPRFLIPHHYDKWDLGLEDPSRVVTALESSYPELLRKTRAVTMKIGERFVVSPAALSRPS